MVNMLNYIILMAVTVVAVSACSTTTLVKPSPALTIDCQYPMIEGKTWGDLAIAYEKRGAALKECTDRMRAIRK